MLKLQVTKLGLYKREKPCALERSFREEGGYKEALKKMGHAEKLWSGGYEEALKEMGYEEALALILICGLLGLILSKKWGNYRKERFPPGPFAWPITGHLHHLINLPHQNLRGLSKKYGPMVGLRLGQQRGVAIASPQLAKEVLSINDKVFANRPAHDFTSELLWGSKNDIIFSPHGPQWRKLRKLCSMTLFTAKRLQELEYVRREEMAALLHTIHDESAGGMRAVDIGRCVGQMSSHLVMRMLQSKASLQIGSENAIDLIKELEHAVSFPIIGDFIPFLSFLDLPHKLQMRRLHDRCDRALSALIAERKQSSSPHDDLLQALLSKEVGHDSSIPLEETFTLDEIKSVILDMLAAGVHTTSLTLEWAMAELLKNPQCLERLRRELDTQLGKKKQITDADIPKLSYLKCVAKEVFRLHPVLPLLVPRISNEECTVNGYTLPANTHMFVNVWAIGRDETLWPHANEFIPERFEGKDIDIKGHNFELLPFGSGRRICLGMPMALSVVDVTLANLVSNFDWELPHGEIHTSINMAEKSGITVNKAVPMTAVPKPRVSP